MRCLVSSTKLLLIVSAVSLAACGGGGDGSDGSIIGLPVDGGGTDTGGSTGGGNTGGNGQVALALGKGNFDSFEAGALSLGANTLSAGGQTTVTVSIVDQANNNNLYTSAPVSVAFTSNCVAQGTATITTPVSTSTGTAQTVYKAQGCVGADTITASISSGAVSASANLTVASQDAGSLSFSSASPTTIALKNLGSAGATTVAEVQFLVKDNTGNALSGQQVNFSLSDTTGGISLTNASAKTDADGIVRAYVNSGTVKTTVRVTAELDSNKALKTTSNAIAIGTGVPSQTSLTVNPEVCNPRGGDFFGTEVKVTTRVSDYYNNPIPDGSKIILTTSGGQIDPECTYDSKIGGCTVNWRSTSPVPESGIAVVMASIKGEEATGADKNANGLFDGDLNGETFQPLGEAYRDDNFNQVWDNDELYIDWNNDGQYTAAPSATFRGVRCSDYAAGQGHCSKLADLFTNMEMSMSTLVKASGVKIFDGNTEVTSLQGGRSYTLVVHDHYENSPPNGTAIEISVTSGNDTLPGGTITTKVTECTTDFFATGFSLTNGTGSSNLRVKITNVDQGTVTKNFPID